MPAKNLPPCPEQNPDGSFPVGFDKVGDPGGTPSGYWWKTSDGHIHGVGDSLGGDKSKQVAPPPKSSPSPKP